MLKAAIFDFNGTLFWDTHFHKEAFITLVERYTAKGIPNLCPRQLTEHDLHVNIMGKPNDLIMPFIFQRPMTKDEIATLGEEKEAIYRNLCKGKVELAPGVYELFAWLNANKIPFTIASSADRPNIDFYYEETLLKDYLPREMVVYNDGTFPGKPEPDIFLRAAQRLGVDMCETVVFEDSTSGITAAERAGAKEVIVVAEPCSTYNGSHRIIRDFKEIIINN